MQHIEKDNVSREFRERLLNILVTEVDVRIVSLRDPLALLDLSCVQVETEERVPAPAFAKIKPEQTNAASNVQDRLAQVAQKFVGRRISRITTQFASDIAAQPELRKLRDHPGASRLVFVLLGWPVFHLLRIIALPD